MLLHETIIIWRAIAVAAEEKAMKAASGNYAVAAVVIQQTRVQHTAISTINNN